MKEELELRYISKIRIQNILTSTAVPSTVTKQTRHIKLGSIKPPQNDHAQTNYIQHNLYLLIVTLHAVFEKYISKVINTSDCYKN